MGTNVIKMPKEFRYNELHNGAFGTVYKGILPVTSDPVAVKRCNYNGQGKEEISELSIICTLRRRSLVKLQGLCHEKGESLSVYDIMTNGSLDKALSRSRTQLPWPQRNKVLLGVASTLAYLHQECKNQMIHRDIKTSNILLDEGFNDRLGDFGLARQIEHAKSPDAIVVAGTMGYLASEYLLTGRVTDKIDIFSYGAVVLEVVSDRKSIEKEVTGVGSNLVDWVWNLHREGRIISAFDLSLRHELFNDGDVIKVLMVSLACRK